MRYYSFVPLFFLTAYTFAQTSILKVGDQAPVPNPYRWLKGTPVTRYDPGHIYVLEFGATWCGPCKQMIPMLTTLQQKYRQQVSVVSFFVSEQNTVKNPALTPSYLPVVERYVAKHQDKMDYAVGLDHPAGTLYTSFVKGTNRSGIPTAIVVDGDGKIGWIGTNPEALRQAVDIIVSGRSVARPRVSELPKDSVKVLFESRISTPATSKPIYYPYHIESYLWLPNDPVLSKRVGTVTAPNRKLIDLYNMAWGDTLWNQVYVRHLPDNQYSDTVKYTYLKHSYGKYYHRPIYEGTNEKALEKRYDYSLRFSNGRSAGALRAQMQADLQANFPFDVTVEVRHMPVWMFVLESEQKFSEARTDGGAFAMVRNEDDSFNFINAKVRDLIWIAGSTYGFTDYDRRQLPPEDQAAFVDRTNLESTFNFRARKNFTFQEFNQMVEQLGLRIVKGTKPMKVVVIRDRK